ncbi:hypothetical protein GQ464_002250 [Rhodocaloribacter litoris]|uniref:hypothetical protein n=1 Tax=Rhodocaloribacter litoris TaxID=2558931 RepID=UPI001E49C093|nr:hypothetical protein [Rhodocaloribacter litoris]QXD15791.1 hypothetical protein GQ464_002250 [Rhodocaloribacter litoris]
MTCLLGIAFSRRAARAVLHGPKWLLALFVLAAVAWLGRTCSRPSAPPPATPSGRVEAPAPLLPRADAVTVARRMDTATVATERIAVQGGRRYAATVTVEAEGAGVVLGLRRVDPGWFAEFRLERPDRVAVDLLPGYEADVMTVAQRLPVFDVEAAPQVGVGLGPEGIAGVAALTLVRAWGVHLGGFVGIGRRAEGPRVSVGGYASVRPRPAFSVGLGVDALTRRPLVTFMLNL